MPWIEPYALQPVIINNISHQLGFPMCQHSMTLCMRLHHRTIIQQGVTGQCQRVSLHHFHMPIRIEGVIILIETCAVAIEVHTIMVQLHMSHQHISTHIHLVLVEHIAVNQFYLFARLLTRFPIRMHSKECANDRQTQASDQQSHTCIRTTLLHRTFNCQLSLNPSRILELTVLPILIDMDISCLLFVSNPLLQFLIA